MSLEFTFQTTRAHHIYLDKLFFLGLDKTLYVYDMSKAGAVKSTGLKFRAFNGQYKWLIALKEDGNYAVIDTESLVVHEDFSQTGGGLMFYTEHVCSFGLKEMPGKLFFYDFGKKEKIAMLNRAESICFSLLSDMVYLTSAKTEDWKKVLGCNLIEAYDLTSGNLIWGKTLPELLEREKLQHIDKIKVSPKYHVWDGSLFMGLTSGKDSEVRLPDGYFTSVKIIDGSLNWVIPLKGTSNMVFPEKAGHAIHIFGNKLSFIDLDTGSISSKEIIHEGKKTFGSSHDVTIRDSIYCLGINFNESGYVRDNFSCLINLESGVSSNHYFYDFGYKPVRVTAVPELDLIITMETSGLLKGYKI